MNPPPDILAFRGEYEFLSNFWPAPTPHNLTIGNQTLDTMWDTTEHAYQAAKAIDINYAQYVHAAPTPAEAKRRGRAVPQRPDWEDIKLSVMAHVVAMKFSYHPDLRLALLNTGEATLVEGNNWGDTFWGKCEGVGENHLGLILMGVRKALRLSLIHISEPTRPY